MSGLTLSDSIAILGILVMIILYHLTRLDSHDANKKQLKTELKTIAKTIECEITKIEKSPAFFTAYTIYTQDPAFLISNPIYPDQKTYVGKHNKYYNKETGLYFTYLHDVNKLDSKLAAKIHAFYNDLIDAEDLRLFLSQKQIFTPYEDPEGLFKYQDMTRLIIKCGNLIPELIEELEKVQNR